MTTTQTAGQQFTATVRSYLNIGTRTRQTPAKLARVFEMIAEENEFPGYYQGDLAAALQGATAMSRSWDKHFDGYRIDPALRYQIQRMSMWQLTALLGRMIDETTHAGSAERWFADLAHEMRASALAA